MSDKYLIDEQKLCYHGDRVKRWFEAKEWKEAKKIYPIYLEVSPFGTCNHECTFCGLQGLEERSSFIDKDVLVERVREMGHLGVKSIMYAGEGEPLLHKGIAEIVSATKGAGIDVAFTTNGVLMEKIFPVLDRISWIKVSLNAGTAETYKKIHKAREGDFDKVLGNIRQAVLLKRKNNYDCVIGAQIVVLPENEEEILNLVHELKKVGADYLVVKPYSPHPLGGDEALKIEDLGYDNPGFLVSLEWVEHHVFSGNFKVIVRYNAFRNIVNEKEHYDRCHSVPFFWSYITAQGDVYSCSVYLGDERFKLGNINEQTFKEIWEGEKRRQNWEMMKDFDASMCRKGCRMDSCNRFLLALKKEDSSSLERFSDDKVKHINFI